MLTWNSMWPATSGDEAGRTPLWDPSSVFELQTRFWNQFIEANRSFWSLYTTALPQLAWPMTSAAVPPAATETEAPAEPELVSEADSVLEAQTRLWNHFLDANRNLWSATAWALPNGPWAGVAEAATVTEPDTKQAKPIASRPTRRTGATGVKSRTARKR